MDMGSAKPGGSRMAALSLAAIGVVYGDIGTSPLYTLKECFSGAHGLAVTQANVLGIASLVFWALIVVVTLKYVLFVMRADNRGEGGILALLALAMHSAHTDKRRMGPVMVLGLFGCALFFGDGIITPAISVLSAVEGLEVASPQSARYVEPITLAVLAVLFWVQSRGTTKIGAVFGPIMVLWFTALGGFGIMEIVTEPTILKALNPLHGARFIIDHGIQAFFVLGSVVLAVTGAEALYADMGHFGKRPIQYAWFALVLPALVLNYFGQAALLLDDPTAVRNPFYLLVPDILLYPMIGLATCAAVIASQAVISGVFSLSRQAVQLGFSPRLEIRHTSDEEEGQIYIPRANWGLFIGIVVLVLGFKSSSNLAGAYGIAVTGTMVCSTVLALVVARTLWGWKLSVCIGLGIAFLAIDLTFLGANMVKIPDGGWFPLIVGLGMFLLMVTWKRGRQILAKRLAEDSLPIEMFLARQKQKPTHRVEGTAIYMTGNPEMVPVAMLHNLKHNKVLHERVVFMTVLFDDIPRVSAKDRVLVEGIAEGFYRMTVRYGFFQEPNLPKVLRLSKAFGLEFDVMQTSFFLGRETLIPSISPEMAEWRERLFVIMSRNSVSATDFFQIPAGRVVELGTQVQL